MRQTGRNNWLGAAYRWERRPEYLTIPGWIRQPRLRTTSRIYPYQDPYSGWRSAARFEHLKERLASNRAFRQINHIGFFAKKINFF